MSSEPEQNDAVKPDEVVEPTAADSVADLADAAEAAPESILPAGDDSVADTQPEETETEQAAAEGALAEDTAEDNGADAEAAVPKAVAETKTAKPAKKAKKAKAEVEQDSTSETPGDAPTKLWYILKVQVNREDSIRDALVRRIKIEGLESQFGDIVVPTEDVAEFNKSGKRRVVKKKLYPGYIMANLELNDDTWFLVRETPGIGDFTGSAGKPTPMDPLEVKRIIKTPEEAESEEPQVRTSIPFSVGDRVRVKEGYFENFEGDVESIDEANGRVTVMINIFGRSTPVELEHWQIESV